MQETRHRHFLVPLVEHTMLQLLEHFSESLADDDAVVFRNTPPVEQEARSDPTAGLGPPSVAIDAGGNTHAEDQKVSVIGHGEPIAPNQNQ